MPKWYVVAALATVTFFPSVAFAEDLPCSFGYTVKNDGWQVGLGPWVGYQVQTILTNPPCMIGAFVNASIEGVGGSALRAEGVWAASASKQINVQRFGSYNVIGRHSRNIIPFGEVFLESTRTRVDVVATQSGDPASDCAAMDGVWRGTWCDFKNSSPLLIDVVGNGFQLTRPERGVQFDIDGDGIVEQVSWTKEGSDDVWLAMDRNGNGIIDNGTELFGNHTPVYGALAKFDENPTASNGFDALKYLEGWTYGKALAQGDTLDAEDPGWTSLLLWQDINHNGISEPDELTRVGDSLLRSIDLTYTEPVRVRSRKGNDLAQVSSVEWGDTRRTIVDVWLNIQ